MKGVKAGTPEGEMTWVNTRDGPMAMYEAETNISIDIDEIDINGAVCNDPKRCAVARCADRRFGAIAVDFHRTVAYIVWPAKKGPYKNVNIQYAVRYTMPADTMRLVNKFDEEKTAEPCTLILTKVTAGRTLRYRRNTMRKLRNKDKPSRSIYPRSTEGPRGGYHYITGTFGAERPL